MQLTPEQTAVRRAARRIVRDKIAGLAADIDRTQRIPQEILDLFHRQGYLRMMLPEEYGGIGADTTTLCLVVEELARACASTAVTLVGHITGILAFCAAADEHQKRRVLATEERQLFAIAITEPEAGSDVAAIRTTASPEGGGWRIDGTKSFVTNGGLADHFLVVVRSPAGSGRGIAALLAARDTRGLIIGKDEGKMGLRGSSTTGLTFDRARVPGENMLDRTADGFKLIMQTLDKTRIIVGALALGIAGGALDYGINYIKTRVQFGRPVADFQAIRFLVADMATRVQAARLLVYDAARLAGANAPDLGVHSAMAKYYASDAAMYVTTNVVQLLGGYGYMTDYPAERMMRDAKATQIFEGTNQIQRLVISRKILT